MPESKPPKTPPKAPAIIAAAVMVAAPIAAHFEGYVKKAAPDPAGIPTYCYGETQNVDPERIYTQDQCMSLLRSRMARDYAPRIAQCLPEVVDSRRVKVFGALIDSSYNAGWSAVCSSPMAAKIRVGDWVGACAAYTAPMTVEGMVTPGWFVSARYRGPAKSVAEMRRAGWTWTGKSWRKVLTGLVTRRKYEQAVCMEGIA